MMMLAQIDLPPVIGLVWFLALTLLLPCVGAALLLLTWELTGGAWLRPLENSLRQLVRLLPFAALAFAPLWLAGSDVFYWLHPTDELLQELAHKREGFLNLPFFLSRCLLYALFFIWLSFRLRKPQKRLLPAAPTLLLLAITMIFFTVDWVMIRAPVWWSSAFPFTLMLGGVLAALSLGVLLNHQALLTAPKKVLRYLGAMLFASLILFAYVGLMELIITYAGDLPAKRGLYTERSGWLSAGVMISAVLFAAIPAFFNLLTLAGKIQLRRLRLSASLLWLLTLVWCWWFIAPFSDDQPGVDQPLSQHHLKQKEGNHE